MEGKVVWSEKVKALFHGGQDEEHIPFCQSLLIWEEAIAFPHLFFDQPRNLARSVFEVCLVDVDALFEHGTLFPPVSWSTAVGIA